MILCCVHRTTSPRQKTKTFGVVWNLSSTLPFRPDTPVMQLTGASVSLRLWRGRGEGGRGEYIVVSDMSLTGLIIVLCVVGIHVTAARRVTQCECDFQRAEMNEERQDYRFGGSGRSPARPAGVVFHASFSAASRAKERSQAPLQFDVRRKVVSALFGGARCERTGQLFRSRELSWPTKRGR